ncbi:hypothetical protein vBSenH9_57 [Salmonella phage vB_Sen_H9]|uniref:Uncharacterized protein n=1 Tax=Salmonella phage vB_Sen_I1 TaxID=2723910 RepID=A0A7L5CDS4_9CAUD|nr:hypothetical protein vBSenI1_88 [Salmonella phage vB_Sen_I1]QJA18022.1 hypothetical protein vBSenH9_57 [Salmonella phage vB_Sen_H9]
MKKLLAYLLGFMVSARPFPLNLDERRACCFLYVSLQK